MDAQVLIVGAGPAGASAAVALAQAGVTDVLLLDRDRFPRDKTCGSGLSPAAIQLAEQLGVGAELRARANPVQSVRFVTPGNREIVMPAHGAAVILLRREFDNLLVDRARALGVRVEEGFRAIELIRDGPRTVGVKSLDGRERRSRFVLCADGAHSIFSPDRRPRRHISTLMGWWENAELPPGRLDMIFDRRVAPLYGWMFSETPCRVNIGICLDAQDADGRKVERDLRSVFYQFLDVWVGEAARVTHNATGEGISQAMQSGVYAAQAVASVLDGERSERSAWRHYLWQHRRRFTVGFVAGHLVRAVVNSSLLDRIAQAYNSSFGQRMIERLLGSALTGTITQGAPVPQLGDGSASTERPPAASN